ncbi:MAG: hypothetical protein QOD06_3404, partial [Candidatus Binatota bacterium]|nr:hypothetical protein [Candidatus Binatota bacterium]
MNPLAKRGWVLSVIAAVALVAAYLTLGRAGGALPSGRSPMGYTLGLLGTIAMVVAGMYSWRRRFIARASRPIEVQTDERKALIARERLALEQLQALGRSLMRNPGQDLRAIRRETKRILKNNRVGRTIEARIESGRGAAPRLVLQRREWGGRLQTWYVSHLSLGTLSVLLILLHAGFRFGNVIATLAFVCLV